MLPQFRTYVLVNNSGSLLTFNNNGRINIKQTCWIVDPITGLVDYTQLADDDLGFIAAGSLADGVDQKRPVSELSPASWNSLPTATTAVAPDSLSENTLSPVVHNDAVTLEASSSRSR